MPLSEQEQRLLDEMERSLYQNDADFVATTVSGAGDPTTRRSWSAALVGVLGIAPLVAGVIIRQPWIGVLGFAVMFAGVLLAVAPRRRPSRPRRRTSTSGRPPAARPSSANSEQASWTASTTAGTSARTAATRLTAAPLTSHFDEGQPSGRPFLSADSALSARRLLSAKSSTSLHFPPPRFSPVNYWLPDTRYSSVSKPDSWIWWWKVE